MKLTEIWLLEVPYKTSREADVTTRTALLKATIVHQLY